MACAASHISFSGIGVPELWDWQEIGDRAETTQFLVPQERQS